MDKGEKIKRDRSKNLEASALSRDSYHPRIGNMTFTQKTAQLVGIRTDRFTQEQRPVKCKIELRNTEKFGWIVIVSKGGVMCHLGSGFRIASSS